MFKIGALFVQLEYNNIIVMTSSLRTMNVADERVPKASCLRRGR